MIIRIKEWVLSVYRGGILYIFGSGVIAKICGFLSSVLVIRQLSKSNYGEYVGANNQYSYISIFVCVGLCNAVLQYCSENVEDSRKEGIYDHSLHMSIGVNILLSVMVVMLSFINMIIGNRKVASYILSMALLPILAGAHEYFLTVFRVRRDNQRYATGNVIFSIALLIGNILFTRIINVYGLVLSHTLAYTIATIYCIRVLSHSGFYNNIQRKRLVLSRQAKKEIDKFAITCVFTNFVSVILTLLDISCLNFLTNRAEVLASYQVASIIPTACMFIPNYLMIYYYPIIVKRCSDANIVDTKFIAKLILLFGIVNGFVTLILFLFAPFIVHVAFSEIYTDSVPIFRILVLNYFVGGTFTKVLGNVIFTLKRVKVNFFHAVLAGILNIVLNIMLIIKFESIGAAIATLCVSTFLSVMKATYILKYKSHMDRR